MASEFPCHSLLTLFVFASAIFFMPAVLFAAPARGEGRPSTMSTALPFPNSEAMDELVRQHRTGPGRLVLRLSDGSALPAGVAARVSQTRHGFLFGGQTNGWGRCPDERTEAEFRKRFVELFNYATVLFQWGKSLGQTDDYEFADGRTQEAHRKSLIAWCRQNHMLTKGHPLVFIYQPKWIAELAPEKREELLWRRVTREARAFAGDIDYWEVVNEPSMIKRTAAKNGGFATQDVVDRYGEVKLIEMAHALVQKADPNVKLIINETWPNKRFYDIARQTIDAGVKVDGVGLQMHGMTGFIKPQQIWAFCEEYKTLGAPLHITELLLPSCAAENRGKLTYSMQKNKAYPTTPEGEARQAEELVQVYRTLFANPSVEAITWWSLSDHLSCCDAPVGLLHADMTPKPAYHAIRKLLKETWWTTAEANTAEGGHVEFTGFFGEYRVDCTHAGQKLTATFTHARGKSGRVELALRRVE
jgi:GH35 family endo-1,4-beta-xylanase